MDEKVQMENKLKNKWRPTIIITRILFASIFIALNGIALGAGDVAAGPTNYEMVEAPTAYILMHGSYDLTTELYENGGLYLRGNVGFKDFFMFGFSANATNMIGQGTIQVQTPGVALKLKLLDQNSSPMALAIAYDNRGYGTLVDGRFFPGTQEGLYVASTHEFQELGWLQTTAGFNVVKFNDFDSSQDLGGFLGTSFAVAKPLLFNVEINQLLSTYWQFNANVVYNIDKPLRVGLDFRDINRGDLFSRIVRIQYMGFF